MSVTANYHAVDADHGESGGEPRHDLREWLDAAAELARAVNRDLPESELVSLIAGTVVHLTGYDFCSVLRPDADANHLLIKGSYGLSPGYVARVNAERPPRISPGARAEGPSSRAFRSQRPVVLADICADPTCLEWEAAAAAQGYRAILALPLVGVGGVLGVLSCYSACTREFAADEVVLMETFTNQAALAIEATMRREHGNAESAHLRRRVELLEQEHQVVQRAEGVHRDLMRLLLAGESLERVTEHLARELRGDVLVEDAAGHPLGASLSEPGLEEMQAIAARLDRTTPLLSRSGDEYRAVELPAGEVAGLVVPVVLAGELAGRVWAFNLREPGGEWQRRVLERGASVVALAVSKLRTAQEVEWRLSREFLDDLLAAKATTDPVATLSRAKQLGIDLTVPHTVLVLRPDPTDDGPGGSPASALRLHRLLLTQVQHVVDASRTDALVAARGADVIVLWPQRADLAEAAEIAERLRGHCTSCIRGSVSVGLGRACSDVTDYTDAYRLATGALNLTQRAGRHDRVVALGDLGVYRLLLQVERPDELIEFMEGMLEPLYTYDARRDTTLVETLRAFLRCGCNATTTAEALIVHPNTIAYRLRRIEELLQVDCHDSHSLLKFQFAFVIEDVLGSGPHT